MGSPEMRGVEQRVAPLLPALEDDIAHDGALYARVQAVHDGSAALSAVQRRLTFVLRERLRRAGAGLDAAAKARLREINARIAGLQSLFNRNTVHDQDTQAVFLDGDRDLAGLTPEQVAAAAAAAAAKGREGGWAIPNLRPAVWPFLQNSTRRDLREQVWRMWMTRGDHPGEHDNKPVIAEILSLRGEKARLLGYPTLAHYVTADRMAGTPETALALLKQTWERVLGPSRALLAELQAIADAEGAGITIAPWDRLHYTEKLRRSRFGVNGDAVKEYFTLDGILQAMFWAAGRVHGLDFEEIEGAPVCHPGIRVFEVRRGAEPVGVLYVDVFHRPGKLHGSWQAQVRSAASFRGRELPISNINSGLPPPPPGEPALLPWAYANVQFHEFGHALHMLLNEAPYPSLGSERVAWDFVELPSLLNERWFGDPDLLARFALHYRTGEPIPQEVIASIDRVTRFDRVFSLNLDYLGPAIVDLTLHLLADGRDIDAVRVEDETLAALGMPAGWDVMMRAPHCYHTFAGGYEAGLYSYLWSDVMAADVAEAFERAPGGLYDPDVALRFRRTILTVGHTVPAAEAFRNFIGRDPDPGALLRRFGLEEAR
jgi:peptidyl-dipeptidase Dcp